jgi:hypothetical protein
MSSRPGRNRPCSPPAARAPGRCQRGVTQGPDQVERTGPEATAHFVTLIAHVVWPSPRSTPRSAAVATLASQKAQRGQPTTPATGPTSPDRRAAGPTRQPPPASQAWQRPGDVENFRAAMAWHGSALPMAPASSRSQSLAAPSSTGIVASRTVAAAMATTPRPSGPKQPRKHDRRQEQRADLNMRPITLPGQRPCRGFRR